MPQLIAEWSPSEAILLAWPTANTDWAGNLASAHASYIELIKAIIEANCCAIILVQPDAIEAAQVCLCEHLGTAKNALLIAADYNDTWVRDYGFLTVEQHGQRHPISFGFNGWGGKYEAAKDNACCPTYLAPWCRHPMLQLPLILEGGAIEIDAEGVLISTLGCLTHPGRNPQISTSEYQTSVFPLLTPKPAVILTHGQLDGDDTDGHIDTLVRFTPQGKILVQTAYNRVDDPHHAELAALYNEVEQRFEHKHCIQLPLAEVYDDDGRRLAASYANYLIVNQSILLPVYDQPEDDIAIERVQAAFPGYQLRPILALPFIEQNGSVHCLTMQIPEGTLLPELINKSIDPVCWCL